MTLKNGQLILGTTPHWNKGAAPDLQDTKTTCTSISSLLHTIATVRMALVFPSCPLYANSSYVTFNLFFCPADEQFVS